MPLGQPLDDIGITESKTQITAHRQADNRGRKRVTRERSTGPSGKEAVALCTTIDLGTPTITTVLDEIFFPQCGHKRHGSCSMELITDPQHTPSLHSPTKPPDGPTRNAGLAAHLTKPTRPLFVLDWIYAPTPHHF